MKDGRPVTVVHGSAEVLEEDGPGGDRRIARDGGLEQQVVFHGKESSGGPI